MFNRDLLINLIERSGISLTALGKEINITHGTLSLLVRGLSLNPQPETIQALANFFGIAPGDFYVDSNSDLTTEWGATNNISYILKSLMQDSGVVNSSELNRRTGIAIPTIDRIINGDTKLPNRSTLIRLAEFFNITVAQLKGLSPIQTNEVINSVGKNTYIPLIRIDDTLKWLETANKTLALKYIKTEMTDINKFSFALEHQPSTTLTITYLIDPSIKPAVGDTILVFDSEHTTIYQYFSDQSYLTINNLEVPISASHKVLGVVVQEIRNRII